MEARSFSSNETKIDNKTNTSVVSPQYQKEPAGVSQIQNSQNMNLLQVSTISDLTTGQGGADILVDNGALLPEIGPLGTVADNIEIPESGEISLYVVRKGDNLSVIAKIYDISVNTIIWANELKKNEPLKEGQILVILPVSGIRYEIKKGDTLKSIAQKYKGSTDDILTFNDISPDDDLTIGNVIIIPDGELMIAENYSTSKISKRRERLWGTGATEFPGYYLKPLNVGRKSQGLHGYNGIDLAAPSGTPIMASANGVVIVDRRDGWGGGYGNYLVISHDNGTQTLYAHNSKNLVNVGQQINQGQTIALVGSTGRSTGPHVHFEIRGAKNPF